MDTTFINRVKKNFAFLKKWAKKENITAFRVYDKDIPQYPCTIDFYAGALVVYQYETPKSQQEYIEQDKEKLSQCLTELKTFFNINADNLFLKARKKQKGLNQYEKQEQKEITQIINEGKMKFKVNLSDYLDCGLFLDHRKTRQLIQNLSKDKKVLNLFAYTGSVSVAAALGGATSVTTIDMSNTYLQWAKDNFVINNLALENNFFIRADVLAWIKDIPLSNTYDLIFIDPPSFSNSKKMLEIFDVQKDYVFLIQQCAKVLNTNGIIFFSNNLKSFKFDDALFNKYFKISNVTKKTIPQDFRNEKIHQAWILEKI